MTYKDLRAGQEIKIREHREARTKARAHYEIVTYTVIKKYPCMCIVEDIKGNRKGLSMGDLVVNGIIRQRPEIEALKKEPLPRTFRKGGS